MRLCDILINVRLKYVSAYPGMEIRDICYDSRKAVPGCAFVAVRGFESDGHKFIADAVKNGASVIISEEKLDISTPFVVVYDTRAALALMSCEFFRRPGKALKVIGVTGTSGKTTSTHLIKHILEEKLHAKVGLIGTNGNMIGDRELHTEHTTPDSYELQKLFREMADEGCSYAVMEVSSHALVLDRVLGTEFYTAAYTNLSQDHLDFHVTMDAYAEAKSRLFSMCRNACINQDDAYAEVMKKAVSNECSLMLYTAEREAASENRAFRGTKAEKLRAEDLRLTASYAAFTAVYKGERCPVRLSIPGRFSVYNALTAISVCLTCGLSLQEAADGLSTATGVKGRVENVPVDRDYTVLIDYSHKPDALEKVLKTLRPVTAGRLFVLFGCGGDRDRAKRPIMGRVACENADVVYITSDNPRTEDPDAIIAEIVTGTAGFSGEIHVITDRIEAIHHALDNAAAGDVILLAGKGHEDYQIVGHEKHHMDEREIVADYLKGKNSL